MKKVDYKKDYKELYLPKNAPTLINVPKMSYIIVEGEGDPNKEDFAKNIEILYALSYAIKMSYKKEIIDNYYEYTVFPLEGIWDLVDKTVSNKNKDNYKYKIMIRQPDFVTKEIFNRFVNQVKLKKPFIDVNKAYFEELDEGLCIQMMHIGPYDDEEKSFKIMEEYCKSKNLRRISLTHKEIYISDPRKAEIDNMKTVLRFKVEIL